MKKEKCITLIGRFLFFGMILASTVLCPIGFDRIEAAEQSSYAKQVEDVKNRVKSLPVLILSNTYERSKDIMQGDVNNDGGVNSIDFAHMRMNLLGMKGSVLTEDNVLIADLNMDRKFDSLDLGVMRGYLLGKISGFSEVVATPVKTVAPTPVPTPSKPSDGDDFTNSIAKASYYVAVGEEVNGKLNFAGDKDFMVFEPPVNGKYRVDIFTNLDSTIGYLYVEKVEGLNYYYNSFKTYCSNESYYIEENLSAGTKYYLGIKNLSGKSSLDSYTIKISKLK